MPFGISLCRLSALGTLSRWNDGIPATGKRQRKDHLDGNRIYALAPRASCLVLVSILENK